MDEPLRRDDLLHAESRLAMRLASGLSLRHPAKRQGIGLGAARSYEKFVMNHASSSALL